jgi:methylamine dehydrogenase accessory protein MauD
MDPFWAATVLVVGGVTAANLLLLLVLIRQYGLLADRLGPAGARMTNEGPEPDVRLDLTALAERTGSVALAAGSGRPMLLLFLDPGCRTCQEMLTAASSVARSEPWLDQAIVALREPSHGAATWASEVPASIPIAVAPDLAADWEIFGGPFAVALDAQRQVRAKGIVNTKQDLDSLISLLDEMLRPRSHTGSEEVPNEAVTTRR